MSAAHVDSVMRAVWALVRSSSSVDAKFEGRAADVERAIWAALDAERAAERERCAQLCEFWDATHPARLAAEIRRA